MNTKTLYWDPPKRDGLGNYIWNYADELQCRWGLIDRNALYNKGIAEIETNSIVYTLCSNKIKIGGYLLEADFYLLDELDKPPIENEFDPDGLEADMQTYASQIIKIQKTRSVYDKNIFLSKIWVK